MRVTFYFFSFFFNDTATTEIYTLSLHDALPICPRKTGGILVEAHTEASAVIFAVVRSEEHTSELQSRSDLVCRLLLEKKNHRVVEALDVIVVDDDAVALLGRQPHLVVGAAEGGGGDWHLSGQACGVELLFFLNDTATTEIYPLSLHDALPIYRATSSLFAPPAAAMTRAPIALPISTAVDRKSTRLNSSHDQISYAVFCLK